MAANDKQVGGNHYKDQAIEPWDYIAANDIGYLEGNAIKYLTRWKTKGGLEDLRKALHYVEKLIELEEQKKQTPASSSRKHSLPAVAGYAERVTDAVVGKMVDRFLGWELPADFSPDCGIEFKPIPGHPNSWPIGTNLFTADQAREMVLFMFGYGPGDQNGK